MKVLAISNLYPPHVIGGYEIGCRDVVDGLCERGHEVQVLTSTYGIAQVCNEGAVHREMQALFQLPAGRLRRRAAVVGREIRNRAVVHRAIRDFRPDVLYIWNISNIGLSVGSEAERAGIPVCYYVSDQWPVRWESDLLYSTMMTSPQSLAAAAATALSRAVLWVGGAALTASRPAMRFTQFTSDFIRGQVENAGYRSQLSWVIPWAVDLNRFQAGSVHWPPRRILYTGQLINHKGVHTALEAFIRIAGHAADATLTIAGGAAIQPAYADQLRRTAAEAGIGNRVLFLGQVPRMELPKILASHDLFLFPSMWDEPFSICLVEALAAGLGVITTLTGGTPEIVLPEENALTFAPGNAEQCAHQLMRMMTDQALYERLRRQARGTVDPQFGFSRMIAQVERSLLNTIAKWSHMPLMHVHRMHSANKMMQS